MEMMSVYSAVLVALVSVCYYNSLECGFVFDDMSAIVENKDLRPHVPISNLFWNDFWGTPMKHEKSHKSYRPLCVLTFRWNYAVNELDPIGYHLVNMILHAVTCIMFMIMCNIFMKEFTSFLAAVMFAVHPIHTEAVTGIVGRAESLSSIFLLAAFVTYIKSTGYRKPINWPLLFSTVSLVTIAMLCKEQGITVIGICCVYEVFVAQRSSGQELLDIVKSLVKGKPQIPDWLRTSISRAGFLVSGTLMLLFARIKVMGAQLPVFTKFDNPASVAPFPARQLTFNYLLPLNFWLLLFPSELCCDWTMGTIPLIESIFDYRNIFTVIFYSSMVLFAKYTLCGQNKRIRAVIISISFMVLPFIPASNLFFPVGFVVAERILYTPSMGFSMLVAIGFEIISSKKAYKGITWCLMLVLLTTHSIKTFYRTADWKSEYTIFQAALKVNDRNAKLFNNVGHALEKVPDYAQALTYFQKAVSVQPDDIGAHINVGRTYNNLNMSREAEQAYRKAIALFPPVISGKSYTARIAPNHLNVYLNLASLVSKDEKRLHEADELLRTAISMRSDYVQGYINRGDVLVKLGRIEEAIKVYEAALKHDPENADLYYNIGVVYLENKNIKMAHEYFTKALQQNPNHPQTLFNSAILLQETGDPNNRPEAYKRLRRLKEQTPTDSKVYFNLAMLDMDEHKFLDAEVNFKKAIEYDETFRSALFNLALMYNNDLNRPSDAIPYLEQLLKHHPDHIKAMILYGDINLNHRKDPVAAEKNFVSVLQIDPNHVQAMHNLCVVYVEKGDLFAAEKCLVRAHNLAPKEDYIFKHLQIVRSRINQAQQQQQRVKEANGQKPVTTEPEMNKEKQTP
ncbi:protein O-mannosyl-transferase TMTC3 isoform X1 [Patella vulgata]|uniref:protein O-mannosyl-transferase TMTC3 isoform X1 n=1 Tax=Patella vulgata TaxID=6465 RepID=UPI00217F589E|nr:protein O-mannosyl-transferase TMTC3 isoform X1 [Patella vulgata]